MTLYDVLISLHVLHFVVTRIGIHTDTESTIVVR